ncbi:hypothetical protein SAMN05878443_1882 [Carnobacterium alterfunditum]|uniref:Uncharacterized protein n=1 Tax=Carnobacterium alterfunditum TaxID=28230 RepID=A0A1N6HIU9_9LACT|nr:hypothetical protein [Carnobacterium alterfunditum]SIO19647.1 hypothetical protein SAMN05878443_1882 [Carnobacterium alterfunditum]
MKKIVGILLISSLLLSNTGGLVVYADTSTDLEANNESSVAAEQVKEQLLEEPISQEAISEEVKVENSESIEQKRYIYNNGPTINLDSISTSQKNAIPGDKVLIDIEINDPSNVRYVYISFRDSNGAILKTELKYNEETKKFESYIVIKDYIINGEMYLYEILAMNKNNSNRTLIYSDKIADENFWREDFSKHSIEVSGSHGPELIPESVSVTKSLDYEHRLEVSFTIKNFKYRRL